MSQVFLSINMSDEPSFVLFSITAGQLLFYVLTKLSTQVQVYALGQCLDKQIQKSNELGGRDRWPGKACLLTEISRLLIQICPRGFRRIYFQLQFINLHRFASQYIYWGTIALRKFQRL